MFRTTKIALCAAIVLGSASVALASNENTSDQSVSAAQAERESRGPQLPWWWNTPPGQGGKAFGYVGTQHEGKKSHRL